MLNTVKHRMMKGSRKKKFDIFLSTTTPTQASTILDVGVADQEYSPYDNFIEKQYDYPHKLTALSIYPLNIFKETYPDIKSVVFKGGKFPFSDKAYSITHSNAVVEHVGKRDKQIEFINEMIRCGGQFFFSTPAKEFPLELHTNFPFIHWLPKEMSNSLYVKLGKRWASGDYMNLFTYKDLVSIMKSSNVKAYKIFVIKLGLLPLHYIVWGKGQ